MSDPARDANMDANAKRLTRLYGTLRLVIRETMRARSREELFRRVCEAAVNSGGFLMAWVGEYDAASDSIVPVAQCGDDGYLRSLKIVVAEGPASRGPSATVFRSGRYCVSNDFLCDPTVAFWHAKAARSGIRASAAFPIREQDAVIGVMSVYAAQPGFFQQEEIALLDEAAADVSFALDNFARERERRRADEIARRFVAIVESTSDAIISKSTDGTITSWNPGAERIFGYSAAEAVGRNVSLLIPPDRAAEEPMILARIARGEQITGFETERIAKDGRRFPASVTISPIRAAGGAVVGASKILRDITDRRRSADALRDANANLELRVRERTEELAVAKERAESADRLKSAFLATMSHELRTPLNSIIGFTGIVLQELPGPLNEEQRRQLGMIEMSSRHLLALINDVLDISKIEAGQLEVRFRPYDLDASLATLIATVAPLAQKKGLALELKLETPRFGLLCSDQRRVEQVLLNLLNNAIKFTEYGTVTLSVDLQGREAVGAACGALQCIRFSVRDTGIGIPPREIANLFQPFHQLDAGLARSHEGTGLGLAICRRLADLLHGRILVESEFGAGSVFHFLLPYTQEACGP